jgi:hypothetical protein
MGQKKTHLTLQVGEKIIRKSLLNPPEGAYEHDDVAY